MIKTSMPQNCPFLINDLFVQYVEVLCSSGKSLITFWYQLTGICFPIKILFSGIPISYSSVTTKFLYSKSLPYQLLLSAITASLLHSSCSDYSLQVLLSAIFISYSFLLLSATLISCS